MKNTQNSPRIIEREALLKVSREIYPTHRDNVSRLFAMLMQRFEIYEKQGKGDVSTRRKYYMKHHKDEYRSILKAIKMQRCTFMANSMLNCNDNLKPYNWVL